MTTVNDILTYLETLAPHHMKMDWDNVGLLCGSRHAPVTKILVALDPFESVCQEAAAIGAQLLITHHPLIFRPVSAVTDDTEVGRSIQSLCKNDISAINAHTNLDCAPGGVNDHLAHTLGLTNIQVIDPTGTDDQGRPWGLLRMGETTTQPLPHFLDTVKGSLHCEGLRYVDAGRPVQKVAVGGGACADGMLDALKAGCDTFVTSDVKYNQFHDAKALGLNLIDAGHYHTENPIVSLLATNLATTFPDLTIHISTHTDCTHYL